MLTFLKELCKSGFILVLIHLFRYSFFAMVKFITVSDHRIFGSCPHLSSAFITRFARFSISTVSATFNRSSENILVASGGLIAEF